MSDTRAEVKIADQSLIGRLRAEASLISSVQLGELKPDVLDPEMVDYAADRLRSLIQPQGLAGEHSDLVAELRVNATCSRYLHPDDKRRMLQAADALERAAEASVGERGESARERA